MCFPKNALLLEQERPIKVSHSYADLFAIGNQKFLGLKPICIVAIFSIHEMLFSFNGKVSEIPNLFLYFLNSFVWK